MKILGSVISGSLIEGFLIRLNPEVPLEVIKTGKFVSILSNQNRFFSMVTDLKLEVTNNDILLFPPSKNENLLQSILKKKDIYATAQVKPMVMLDRYNNVKPVKTIPEHFSDVIEVAQDEVSLIFGDEKKDTKYFNIGNPLDMQTGVCLDLDKLVERSNAVFGKTGTGKTFITRLILAGLISNKKAVNLIFDMHSEYGLQARKEGSNTFVKGLKTLFNEKIAIFSLDSASTRRRGSMPDVEVVIPYQAVNVEDVLSLQDELNLHSTAVEAAYLIACKYKKNWLSALLEKGADAKEFAQEVGAHPESVSALYRKLKRIERLPFFTCEYKKFSVVDQIIEYLDKGVNIIIEFGNFNSTFVYLLIANILTRRIHAQYIEKTEKFLGSQNKSDEPRKLLITIEEAHKFLNPIAAKQTIFGTIAREMRKYYVSLLLVDQRPSGVDPEILSQVGTKIIAQLSDEKDIQSVLTGVANSHVLRGVLSTLDSKKQVLVIGHAIAMPVVLETREYGDKFYQEIGTVPIQDIKEVINEIF